jgi:hypothetical protein
MTNTDDKNIREMDPASGFENLNEIRERQEKVFENADRIKNSTSLFWIVVKVLQDKGYELPNSKIIDIKTMYAGKDYVVVKFSGDISFTFDPDSDIVLSKIREDAQMLDYSDAMVYKHKYYDYAVRFLEEKENVLDSGSSLAVEKLSRLGI